MPELDFIRRNCKAYIHTHTLCGSAPSLIEMIVAQKPIFSIDIPQNRFTLKNNGFFFKNFTDLDSVLFRKDLNSYIPTQECANMYAWHEIIRKYEDCFN